MIPIKLVFTWFFTVFYAYWIDKDKPENKEILDKLQQKIEDNWNEILRLCNEEPYELK